ncbi:sensor histidine kinase [Flavobacterium aurantiibacter]|uniref:histidine kinase n=1 Tax=Flavobacterium aurantiibacter TaxID=2023067 RepID=A0A255ZDN6_9FLAO|nr:sensor histidine kinase [Flavobacterium aurantiibacter]OYQ39596.1 hypothetical protein CHX27_13945 [Flavobacterium aurantiibacter]
MQQKHLKHIKYIFILAAALLVSLSVISFVRSGNMANASRLVSHTNSVMFQVNDLFSHLKDAESSQRAYVLSRESVFKQQYAQAVKATLTAYDECTALISDNFEQQQRMLKLKQNIDRRIRFMDAIMRDADSTKISPKRWLVARSIMEEIRALNKEIINEEIILLKKRQALLSQESTLAPLLTAILSIFSIVIVVFSYLGITRELARSNAFQQDLAHRNQELADRNIELKNMNKELESFNYISSHDLQEPLRKIQTFLSRVVNQDSSEVTEQTKYYLLRAQDAAKRMQDLIQDLLSYSRLNAEQFKAEKVDFFDLVARIQTQNQEEIESTGTTIVVSGTPEIEVIVKQFPQLLVNIFSNAMKYVAPHVKPFITVQNRVVTAKEVSAFGFSPQAAEYYQISVSDNGIGFNEAFKDKIFDLFQRLHPASAYSGTGIGLAIVKKIVDNHNGFVTVSSSENQGSTFFVFLLKSVL